MAASLLLVLAGILLGRPAAGVADDRLTIVTGSGSHAYTVETALTPEQRATGLMNRKSMADDHGMLFRFDETRQVMMWMKSTYIPLDMVFIKEDGTVAGIKENAQPLSETIIASPGPVRFVLELNGGEAQRIGARRGDSVSHPLIEPADGG